MKKIYILLLFFLTSTFCFSQIKNISQFLDDGGRTDAKDIVKIDFAEILRANIPIILEHRFSDNFALQVGVGLLTHSFYKPLINPIISISKLNPNLKGGFSLYTKPVFYLHGFESFHFGVPLYYRNHSNQASSFEFRIEIGNQWFIGRHFAVELDGGIGINNEYSLDGVSYIYNTDIFSKDYGNESRPRIVFPISIKLGYVL